PSFGGRQRLLRFGCRLLLWLCGGFCGFRRRLRLGLRRGVCHPGIGLARTLAARRRLGTRLLGTRLDQADRLIERDLVRVLVVRDGGVVAVVGPVRPVASLLDQDRPATLRVVAERAARIGAEAAPLAGIGALLGDQRDRAVEADGEHVLARI